jgi:uncharacterized protein YaeQ
VALSSTVFTFEIDLADSNRGVYESLALRVARHPSEADEFLVARVLAYCLEYAPGIEFSRGLSDADEPPVAVRDPTGAMQVWIDVGTPSAERLHRAAKAVPRVAVYVHKDPRQWLDALSSARIYRREALESMPSIVRSSVPWPDGWTVASRSRSQFLMPIWPCRSTTIP